LLAQSQFSWHNQFHFVLEEDGSSISPDVMELILTGEEKIGTIMMLKDGEKWSPGLYTIAEGKFLLYGLTSAIHDVAPLFLRVWCLLN
jgi:hypothetical protein